MLHCSNEAKACPNGGYIHVQCANLKEDEIPDGDWFCSDDCKVVSKYCFCKKNLGKKVPMIMCDQGKACKEGQWFHYEFQEYFVATYKQKHLRE